jgi:hypothetical protein
MTARRRSFTEQVQDLTVCAGESVAIQGGLSRGVVERDGILTVQGTVADLLIRPGGMAICQGTVVGRIEIGQDGLAVVQGLVAADIVNRGRFVLDASVLPGAEVRNDAGGLQLSRGDLPPELRRLLSEFTTTYSSEPPDPRPETATPAPGSPPPACAASPPLSPLAPRPSRGSRYRRLLRPRPPRGSAPRSLAGCGTQLRPPH